MARHVILLVALLLLPPSPQQDIGTALLRTVPRIEGKTNEGRREFIKQELRAMKVPFRTQPFDTTIKRAARETRITGENIIVRMGSGKRHIVVGAHYDAVPNSPGANDNGGGVALLLGLIRTLKEYPWRVSIDFCFFDQEEVGLIGSAVYVREHRERDRHLAMLNLDVVGTGEEVYVGPVGGGDDDLVMQYVRKARDNTRFPYFEHAVYPSSDHLSFAAAQLENISISIVPKGDGERIVNLLTGEARGRENYPRVLEVMHTPRDSSTYMSASALGMSYEFVKTVLMLLNDSQK